MQMSSSASTIDFLGLVSLFESSDTSVIENTDGTELESYDLLEHDSLDFSAQRQGRSSHGTSPIAEVSTGPLVLVKQEFAKIPNNSGSTFGRNKKRYREKKTAVPTLIDMHPYLGRNDLAIEYFKSVGVIKNRVDEQCELKYAVKPGRAGSKPEPRQCKGFLVERKFDKRDGQGDPVYSRFYRCTK